MKKYGYYFIAAALILAITLTVVLTSLKGKTKLDVENKDPMFGTLSTMLNLQLLTNMYSMMFRERNNNEEKEN